MMYQITKESKQGVTISQYILYNQYYRILRIDYNCASLLLFHHVSLLQVWVYSIILQKVLQVSFASDGNCVIWIHLDHKNLTTSTTTTTAVATTTT